MCNSCLELRFQIGTLKELHKRELITERELDRCIQILMNKWRKENETCSSILQGIN